MAHSRDGIVRTRAGHFGWMATLARIYPRDPEIWFSLPNDIHLGSGSRAIRGVALRLRNVGVFVHRTAPRGAAGNRYSSVSNRACAFVDSAAIGFTDRNARGNSQRDPWAVGNFRDDSLAARFSISVPQAVLWLDAIFHGTHLRAVHVGRRNYHRDNDSANHHFGFAGDFAKRPEFAARSGLRARCNALGSHAHRGAELRQKGIVRCCHPRAWTRAWRNDGGDDGDWQHAADCRVSLQT